MVGLGHGPTVGGRVEGVSFDDAKDGKVGGQGAAGMKRQQERYHGRDTIRAKGRMLTGNELGDQGSDGCQCAKNGWSDAQQRGSLRGLDLGRTVDTQEFGSLTGESNDVGATVGQGHLVVAIGDAERQRFDREVKAVPCRHEVNQSIDLAHGPMVCDARPLPFRGRFVLFI